MGSASSRPPQGTAATRVYFNSDLPKLVLQSKMGKNGMIGDGKFMKSYCMKADGYGIVVKVYMRLADEDVSVFQERLHQLWINLSPTKYPNLLPYQMWIRSHSVKQKYQPQPIYLLRQHLAHNLYDRCLSRPFLTFTEKMWLIYQLFVALEQCHECGVVHGDVKPENVLSSNWHFVVLTDFAPYKPTVIPNDDPTDFHYYFDTSGRRSCYVAPERFAPHNSIAKDKDSASSGANKRERNEPLTPAMDVFSLGCTIAEMLLDCKNPLLDLPGMVQYVSKSANGAHAFERLDDDNSPCKALLSRIADTRLRNVVVHMTQREPGARLTLREYRSVLQGTTELTLPTSNARPRAASRAEVPAQFAPAGVAPSAGAGARTGTADATPPFPSYFENAMLPLFWGLHWSGVTPDRRVSMICHNYNVLLESITGQRDDVGQLLLSKALAHIPYVDPCRDRDRAAEGPPGVGLTPGSKIIDVADVEVDVSDEMKAKIRAEYMRAALYRKPKGLDVCALSQEVGGGGVSAGAGIGYAHAVQTDAHFQNGSASDATAGLPLPLQASEKATARSTEQLAKRCREFLASVQAELAGVGQNGSPAVASSTGAAPAAGPPLGSRAAESMSLEAQLQAVEAGIEGLSSNLAGIFLHNQYASLSSASSSSSALSSRKVYPGMEIIVTLLGSVFRHLRFPQSKTCVVLLLTCIGPYCEDEVILQRIVPIFSVCMEDENSAHIRAMALRALTNLLHQIRSITAAEADIFPLCLLPTLNRLIRDPDVIVRVAFAECLGRLAQCSKRFLDLAYLAAQSKALKTHVVNSRNLSSKSGKEMSLPQPEPRAGASDGSASIMPPAPPTTPPVGAQGVSSTGSQGLTSTQAQAQAQAQGLVAAVTVDYPFEEKLQELHEHVAQWIKTLSDESSGNDLRRGSGLSSNASQIKRMLLSDIARICVFFGPEATVSQLLPHLLTFFSDQDWELRHCFWENIASVCAFIGRTLTEAYILPGLDNALVDVEERVVVCALHYLQKLCELHLVSKKRVLLGYIASKVPSLLLNPSNPVREAAASFVASVSRSLGAVDTAVFLLPILRPLFKHDVATSMVLSTDTLLSLLTSPVDRTDYRTGLLQRQKRYLERSSVHADVVATYSSSIGGSAPEQDPSTQAKLLIMADYIDQSARELASKTMQWRHALVGGINAGSFSASLRRTLSLKQNGGGAGSLDTLLSITSTHSLSQNLQSLMVPHQKFGSGYYYTLTEEQRSLASRVDEMRNPASISALYGISNTQRDSAHALNQGIPADLQTLTAQLLRQETGEATVPKVAGASETPLDNVLQMHNVALAYDAITYANRIHALGIPPLPPDMGTLVQPNLGDERKSRYYNAYTEELDRSSGLDAAPAKGAWRPRENVLICSILEHTQAVNRLAVCPDQSFFGSASSDGTVKIWQLAGLNREVVPQSALTYHGHHSPVTDLAFIENSHSMASAAKNGSVHVWRVDVEAIVPDDAANGTAKGAGHSSHKVTGLSMMKQISCDEGAVVGLQHFSSEAASVLMYATHSGGVHGWDLRSSREAFYFGVGPELGPTTAMAIAPDRSWALIGTALGFICLWDLRYNLLCKVWQHSSAGPIWKLACSTPQNDRTANASGASAALADTEGAYLFVASGENEVAVWGLPEAGECIKCFRSVPLAHSRTPLAPLPVLTEVPLSRHPGGIITAAYQQSRGSASASASGHSVRAYVGRTPVYLITAGSDHTVRYWDFKSPAKCFVVSGLEPGQPKATFEAPTVDGFNARLFVSYDSALPTLDATLPAHLPVRSDRGPLAPNPGFRSPILDTKLVELPMKGLLTCAKDGIVKFWR